MSNQLYLILMLILGVILASGIMLIRLDRSDRQIDRGRRSMIGLASDPENRAIFFGVQIAMQVFGSDNLRKAIFDILGCNETTEDPATKRRTIRAISALLLENRYAWEYGFWDFRADAEEAIETFIEWQNGIEMAMATEPEQLGEAPDQLHRFSDDKEYLILTIMMLIDNRPEPIADDEGDYDLRPTAAQLAAPLVDLASGVSEENYWKETTFAELLDGLSALDPRVIERDGIYIFPGNAQDGLSSLDLLGDDGWKYLTEHSFRLN